MALRQVLTAEQKESIHHLIQIVNQAHRKIENIDESINLFQAIKDKNIVELMECAQNNDIRKIKEIKEISTQLLSDDAIYLQTVEFFIGCIQDKLALQALKKRFDKLCLALNELYDYIKRTIEKQTALLDFIKKYEKSILRHIKNICLKPLVDFLEKKLNTVDELTYVESKKIIYIPRAALETLLKTHKQSINNPDAIVDYIQGILLENKSNSILEKAESKLSITEITLFEKTSSVSLKEIETPSVEDDSIEILEVNLKYLNSEYLRNLENEINNYEKIKTLYQNVIAFPNPEKLAINLESTLQYLYLLDQSTSVSQDSFIDSAASFLNLIFLYDVNLKFFKLFFENSNKPLDEYNIDHASQDGYIVEEIIARTEIKGQESEIIPILIEPVQFLTRLPLLLQTLEKSVVEIEKIKHKEFKIDIQLVKMVIQVLLKKAQDIANISNNSDGLKINNASYKAKIELAPIIKLLKEILNNEKADNLSLISTNDRNNDRRESFVSYINHFAAYLKAYVKYNESLFKLWKHGGGGKDRAMRCLNLWDSLLRLACTKLIGQAGNPKGIISAFERLIKIAILFLRNYISGQYRKRSAKTYIMAYILELKEVYTKLNESGDLENPSENKISHYLEKVGSDKANREDYFKELVNEWLMDKPNTIPTVLDLLGLKTEEELSKKIDTSESLVNTNRRQNG